MASPCPAVQRKCAGPAWEVLPRPAPEPIACARCGLLLAERGTRAVVAVHRDGAACLDPAAIKCERCGAVWSNPAAGGEPRETRTP